MRLRTGLRVLWCATDEVQVGTDSRWAVRLTGLTPIEVSILLTLNDGTSTRTLASQARVLGVGPARVDSLIRLLDGADLLTGTGGGPLQGAKALPPGSTPDSATWSRVLADGDGDGLLAARRARVVGLIGAGRLGLSAAVTLAAAGVGTVLVEDGEPVFASDLGVGGYTTRDLTSPRRDAAARVLRDVAASVRTRAPARTLPDVMLLVEHGAADALRARALMSAGIVHLSVVVREADVVVGPLVRPGLAPCLRCLDLHRTDADRRWPTLAAQLVDVRAAPGTAGTPGPSTRRDGPTHRVDEESLLAAIAGPLAAGQVLAQLDGTDPVTVGAQLEIALPEAVPRLRTWASHPSCGCAGLPGTNHPGTNHPGTNHPGTRLPRR